MVDLIEKFFDGAVLLRRVERQQVVHNENVSMHDGPYDPSMSSIVHYHTTHSHTRRSQVAG
jgi:hypothetical protein